MKWIFGQQVLVRLAIALKFFILARMLGPEAIGQAVLALTCLAVLESISDFGLGQALVQRGADPGPRLLGQVFTLNLARGVVLALMLAPLPVVAPWLGISPSAASLFVVLPGIALAKTCISPRYALAQRRRGFRQLFFADASCGLIDLIASIGLAWQGFGAASILVGTLIGEAAKTTISWRLSRDEVDFNCRWVEARDVTSFGLWVWLGGVVTALLNQGDKFAVSVLFGERELGLYQTVLKGAQLLFSDASTALCMYAFPVLSQARRESATAASRAYTRFRAALLAYVAVMSVPALLWGNALLLAILGSKWFGVDHYFAYAMLPVTVGSVLTLRVTFDRALGHPERAVGATLLQALAFAGALYLGHGHVPGSSAVLVASSVGGAVALGFLELVYRKRND